jgi:four helix bundle protein
VAWKLQDTPARTGGAAWWETEEAADDGLLREEPENGTARHPWDLVERATLFGEAVVRFSRKIPRDPSNNRLIDQIVGCGTSIGANYCEANEAVSKKDFKNTVSRCVKEAKETKFFLRMIVASEPQFATDARPLYREAHELLCIFSSMRHKTTTSDV